MIDFKEHFNVFDTRINVSVVTVNLRAIMGAGIAKDCKNRYPEVYEAYAKDCFNDIIGIGNCTEYTARDGRKIICFPTKTTWKRPSKYEYIHRGLKDLYSILLGTNPQLVVGVPPLGCGLGGLDYKVVKEMIIKALDSLPNEIWIVK